MFWGNIINSQGPQNILIFEGNIAKLNTIVVRTVPQGRSVNIPFFCNYHDGKEIPGTIDVKQEMSLIVSNLNYSLESCLVPNIT